MTDSNNYNANVVSGVTYNPAGQLTQMIASGYGTEARSYNALGQLTNITVGASLNITYTYPAAGQNNGKIASQTDAITGETVTYAYDSLNRLISAQSGSTWGQGFQYDGFGNLTAKTVLAGSVPTLSVGIDGATNHMIGQAYDANGNMLSSPMGQTLAYDAENRLTSTTSGSSRVRYAYDGQNKRIWSCQWDPDAQQCVETYGSTTEKFYFYGPDGKLLATLAPTYTPASGPYYQITPPSLKINSIGGPAYFGGRMLGAEDRLGSHGRYYPYGEDRDSDLTQKNPGDGGFTYATYMRDSATGLNYADQRYYAAGWGRFASPDPSGDAWDPANPGTWNSYAYVLGDPVNLTDPDGLVECGDLDVVGGGTLRDYMDASGYAGKLTRFVWAEGGTLAASGGSQSALGLSMAYIAQAIENRLDVANGRVAVAGIDGNIYWGNGGTFNGVTTLAASILGYGGVGTTLSQELVRAAAGTGEVGSNGELVDKSGLEASLNTELGDPTRALPGRVPVTLVDGSTVYVTPECDRAILAMQATNTILEGNTLNQTGSFVTSWKQAAWGPPRIPQ